MSFFFLLLLFLFVWFIVVPVVKGVMIVNRFRNNARDMFNRAAGRTNDSQKNNPNSPTFKRKKIDSSVGEYIEFEEIQVTETKTQASTDDGSKYYKTESQVVDVEWEEIG